MSQQTDISDLSERELVLKILSGEISRNKNFDFSKTQKGKNVFKKAKHIKGILQDLDEGAVITDRDTYQGSMKLVLENNEKKYTRTVFFDEQLLDIIDNYTPKTQEV